MKYHISLHILMLLVNILTGDKIMKNWLKNKLTGLAFWSGILMIVGAFLFPKHLFIYIGIVLIVVDDSIISTWLKKISPQLSDWLDEV